VYGYAAYIILSELDFTRMHTHANINANLGNRVGDRICATERPAGPVERREKTVSERLDLAAPEPL
jgi:hypothetical protein